MPIVRSVREVGSIMLTMFSYNKRLCREFVKETNLTKATKEERIKLLEEAGIPLK